MTEKFSNYQMKKLINKKGYNIIGTEDPKLDYIIGTKGKDNDLKRLKEEYSPLSKVDYSIGNEKILKEEDKPLPDTRKDLSFLQVKTIEEGIEWYRKLDPKIPDEILSIMARWNWGDLSTITKKQIKNERKKDKKKGKKAGLETGIKIRKATKENPILLTFD
tara:strand:+ start:62 stop:547 length:486 start_codon:yes stop_codon:yes gene_type:complete